MENKKKIITFLSFGLATLVYHLNEPSIAFSSMTQNVNKVAASNRKYIGNNLYKNRKNEIFLKVKNRGLLHPSQLSKPIKKYIYLDKVYIDHEKDLVALKKILDIKTFKQVSASGSYFMDRAYIYVYMTTPHPVQFFALPRGGERFLDTDRNFLLHKKTLYYQGNTVQGLDVDNLSIVKYKNKDDGDFLEFVTDGKSIYYSTQAINKEDLKFFHGLSEFDKNKIIKRFALD